MEVNVTVTVELSQATKDFLSNLLSGWTSLTPVQKIEAYPTLETTNVEQGVEVYEAIKKAAKAPTVTLQEVQALAIAKAKEFGGPALRAVLEELKAEKVTAIPEEDLPRARELLEAINDQ